MTNDHGHICPPDHGHGRTNTCRTNHRCRCDDCRRAHREHARAVRRAKAYGRYDPGFVPAVGTHRRIQALVRQGWSQKRLCERLGWAQQRVSQVLASQRLSKHIVAQVDQLFRDLWDKQPPQGTSTERIAAARARKYAMQRGWPPPLAWDDIDHDEGPAVVTRMNDSVDEANVDLAVTGVTVALTPAERTAAVLVLHPQGLNDHEIAARIGCSDRTVLRIRDRHGLSHNDTLHNRPAAA